MAILRDYNNLTFDQLFDFVAESQTATEVDKKIAQKILEAERDWRTSETFCEHRGYLSSAYWPKVVDQTPPRTGRIRDQEWVSGCRCDQALDELKKSKAI